MKQNRVKVIKYNEMLLRNQIKDFTVNFKKRYDKFPWKLINRVPSSIDNKIVSVNGASFTIKSLKLEICKINKGIKPKTRPSGFQTFISAYKREAIHTMRTGGDVNKVYIGFKDSLNTAFKQTNQDFIFCVNALKQLTKYMKDKDQRQAVFEACNDLMSSEFDETCSRKNLPDRDFGIPSKRKFPLDTENHVRSAAKFFNYANDDEKPLLARKIKQRSKYYNIDLKPGENNKLKNYMNESEDGIMPYEFDEDDLRDILLESFIELEESEIDDDFDDAEEVTEGQNTDIRAIYKSYKKIIKKNLKECKGYIKADDTAKAKAKLEETREIIKKAEVAISKYELDDVGSMIFSWITSWTIDLGNTLLVFVTMYIPIVNIITVIKEIVNSTRAYRATGLHAGKSSVSIPEAFNGTKQMCMRVMERYAKAIEMMEKHLEANAKIMRKAKVAKESTQLDDDILEIYERCANGEISIEERDELVNYLMESEKEDRILELSFLESEMELEKSKHEKFANIKRLLYERCSNGEITYDEREDLIDAAYSRIFEDATMTNSNMNMKANDIGKDAKKETEKIQKEMEKNMKQTNSPSITA